MRYRQYTVTVGTDPVEYGFLGTEAEAISCADMLAQLIADEFEAIRVNVRESGGPVCGPDAQVCDEIRLWIQTQGTPIAFATHANH